MATKQPTLQTVLNTVNDLGRELKREMQDMRSDIVDIREIVQFTHEHATTKDDLKRFATKDDLKRFATKDDLKRFATKDDLKDGLNDLKQELIKPIRKNTENITLLQQQINPA